LYNAGNKARLSNSNAAELHQNESFIKNQKLRFESLFCYMQLNSKLINCSSNKFKFITIITLQDDTANLILLNQEEIFSIQFQASYKISSLFFRPQTQRICTAT